MPQPSRFIIGAVICGWLALFFFPQPSFGQPAPAQSANDLTDAALVDLLSLLINQDHKRRRAALRELDRRKDVRAVPGLIELMRVRKAEPDSDVEILLRNLTGRNLGSSWVKWSERLTAQERVELPPRFREWKAALLSLIDPAFGKFLHAEEPLRIRIEEVVWGGVKKDGIPALTNPKLIGANEASYLSDSDLVFGVEINGDARAYPLRIMDWHEMLNDVIGGQAVSLAYCTLCRSGILFDTRAGDRTFTFGSSGLLYRSNKLMYDRETESLWMTIPGEPVGGKLANSGIKLKKLSLVVTTWSDWRRQHPATRVLSPDTGHKRDYSPGAAYGAYFASPDLMFPAPNLDARMKPKEEVFALEINGESKAYALKKLRQTPILHDVLGGENIVLITNEKTSAVRAYSAGKRQFTRRDPLLLIAEDGQQWGVTESALVDRKTNEQLPRLPGHLAYWFGWASFHPRTALWK